MQGDIYKSYGTKPYGWSAATNPHGRRSNLSLPSDRNDLEHLKYPCPIKHNSAIITAWDHINCLSPKAIIQTHATEEPCIYPLPLYPISPSAAYNHRSLNIAPIASKFLPNLRAPTPNTLSLNTNTPYLHYPTPQSRLSKLQNPKPFPINHI